MPIHFIECDVCQAKFRVKTTKKPYVGKYKDKPVYHWHYLCVRCGHVHTVRFYNEFVNTYFDKVISLEFSIWLNRKDEVKHNQLLREYENAKLELDKVNEEVKKAIGLAN